MAYEAFAEVYEELMDNVPYDKRPEAGLLRLRKDLDLFANLRPAICYPALAEASSFSKSNASGVARYFS